MSAASPALAQALRAQPQSTAQALARYSQQPLLYAACAYALGIWMGEHQWRPDVWLIASAALLLAAACFFLARGRERVAAALVFIVFALLGALSLQVKGDPAAAMSNNDEFFSLTSGDETLVTAHVIREGVVERQGGELRQSVDVATDEESAGDKTYALHFGARVSIYSREPREDAAQDAEQAQPAHVFHYGERVRFAAKLKQPRNFGDPGAFDYRGYLAQQGIAALANTRQDAIELLPGESGTRLGQWRSRVRESIQQKIALLWHGKDAALISAMLIGDRTGVDRETLADYQRTGAYHILVVAGLKVGILAFVMLWIGRRLRLPAWAATAITIAVTLGYAEITEANAPVMRATAMLAIYLVARLFYRDRSALNAVGAAALGILLWNARALFDASFQLTFVSILAIAGIALPLFETTSSPFRRALEQIDSRECDFALPPKMVQFRLDLRLIAGRLARGLGAAPARWMLVEGWRTALRIYELLALSAVLQLALAAPMAIYFHRAVALGLPANAGVVPLHALLLPAAAAAVLVAYISVNIASGLASFAALLLHGTNWIVEQLAHWRPYGLAIGDWRVATPREAAVIFAAMAMLFALVVVKRGRKPAIAALTLLAAAGIWVCVPQRAKFEPAALEVTAIDVGQGDAILVVTPQGRTLLIDAGGELGAPGGTRFDVGEDVVSPYLWSRGITHLDALALTHAHADHIGGMPAVILNFHPDELWVADLPDISAVAQLLQAARKSGTRVVHRAAGERFSFGGVDFRVLAPPADWPVARDKASNNDSLVLKANYAGRSVLFEGDAERRIEEEMADEDPSATLLKVAHHGSATSTTAEMLAAVHPEFAVISVGFHSPFHHPRPEVLGRLQAAHVRTFRTDTMGATTFYLDARGVRATSWAEQQR